MKHEKHSGLGGAWLVLGLLASVAPNWVAAQQPAVPAAPAPAAAQPAQKATEELDELDEVLVNGGRLYDRIVRAEDKFFAEYNKLNKDDDFDTNCASLPINANSKIEQRFCMPVFFADATAEQVRLTLQCVQSAGKDENGEVLRDENGNIADPAICIAPVTADQIFYARREAYVDNVLEVINGNPELKKMALEVEALHREREALAHRFDDIKERQMAVRAEKNKDRPKIR